MKKTLKNQINTSETRIRRRWADTRSLNTDSLTHGWSVGGKRRRTRHGNPGNTRGAASLSKTCCVACRLEISCLFVPFVPSCVPPGLSEYGTDTSASVYKYFFSGAFPWSSWEVASTSPTSSSFSSTVPPTLYVCWWDFHDGGPLENVTMIVRVLCSRLSWITRLASVSACLVIAKPIVAESPSVAEASLLRVLLRVQCHCSQGRLLFFIGAFRVYVFIMPVLVLHLHVVTINVLSSFKSRQRRSHARNWCDDDWEARFSVRIRQGFRFGSPWRFLQVLSVRRSDELHDHRSCISHTTFTSGCMATGICFFFCSHFWFC